MRRLLGTLDPLYFPGASVSTLNLASKLKVLRVLGFVPLLFIVVFVFGAKSMSPSAAAAIFWLAHLTTIVCLFFIIPLARSLGKSGFLWGIGTMLFSPVGPAVSTIRLLLMFHEHGNKGPNT